MEKIALDYHPSVTFICPKKDTGEVILSGYDGSYGKPRKTGDVSRAIAYRSKPNLLGGNPQLAEKLQGPYNTLIREIDEEVRRVDSKLDFYGKPILWATDKDLDFIRGGIIPNLHPYGDFLSRAESVEGGIATCNAINAISSTYVAVIPMDVVECIRDNIRNGKRLSNEGYIGIHYLKQLEAAGEFSTVHATAPILNDHFGTHIPYPDEIKVTRLVKNVRKKYRDYEDEFIHEDSVWKV